MDKSLEDIEEATPIVFTRRALLESLTRSSKTTLDDKLTDLEDELIRQTNCPARKIQVFRRALRFFRSEYKTRWTNSFRNRAQFEKCNSDWLDGSVNLPTWVLKKGGRPKKEFSELSERGKRRETEALRHQFPADQLLYAAQMSQREVGNAEIANVIKHITKNPEKATEVKQALNRSENTSKNEKISPIEALAMIVEADLTVKQYEVIRAASKGIFPCYTLVQRAKLSLYPLEESTTVSDNHIEVKLQSLLDLTVSRMFEYLDEVIANKCTTEESQNFELISKWGCDGSQQSTYEQAFTTENAEDGHIFQSSLVPLRLTTKIGNKQEIIWQNPVPSSPRYCRPIRIRFIAENSDVIKEEIDHIENQVKTLEKTTIRTAEDSVFYIKHTLVPTMVDGKICNSATNTAYTRRCYICGLTSKDFNNLTMLNEENPETFKFGLSILHARIRFLESMLSLSYKLQLPQDMKKPEIRDPEAKKIISNTKKEVQRKFWEEMKLMVDKPKQGFGNTNCGNTSRRFFADPEKSSKITGIDINLIKRLSVVLEVIASGFSVDVEKFSEYCSDTAKLYVRLYPWQPMTPTIHKILIHGPTVISHALLPIGQLSEEAAKARNKSFRTFRQDFARKFSRKECNTDIFHRLLLNSDPLITSCRSKPKKITKPFSPEALQLLKTPSTDEDDAHAEVSCDDAMEVC